MGSMNLDDLLNHVFSSQSNPTTAHQDAQAPRQRGPSAAKIKTVDEVWREIQRGQQLFNNAYEEVEDRKPSQDHRQPTLGEMTLEDFLIKAGVVSEAPAPAMDKGFGGDQGDVKPFIGGDVPLIHSVFTGSQPQPPQQGHCLPYPSRQRSQAQQLNEIDSPFPAPSSTLTTLSDAQTPGVTRIADKSVERRQKRMIKNRESAARSRARKQAYTNELENKVSRLEEENVKLRREREFDCVPLPDTKYQLRRTSSGPL